MTDSAGREFSKICFMAPFLRVSLFAEDDVSFSTIVEVLPA